MCLPCHPRPLSPTQPRFRRPSNVLARALAAHEKRMCDPNPPLQLLGDNAAEAIQLILCDRITSDLDRMEEEVNGKIHALWLLNRGGTPMGHEQFREEVEGLVGGWREGVRGVYNHLAHLHGRLLTSIAFTRTGALTRMPRDYLQLLSERDDFPIDITLLDAVEAIAAKRRRRSNEIRREMLGLERWEADEDEDEQDEEGGVKGVGKGKGEGDDSSGTLVGSEGGEWETRDGTGRGLRVEEEGSDEEMVVVISSSERWE